MKTRVAIAGLGGVAERIHLPACRSVPEIELAGGADPDAAVRTRVADRSSLPRVFADVDAMLAELRPEILIVGTPPATHFEICRKALQVGVNVFCEKPFMASVEEADGIIALARANRLGLRVNNQYRYMSFYADAKRRILADEFGPAYAIEFWQHMFHPPSTESNWRSR